MSELSAISVTDEEETTISSSSLVVDPQNRDVEKAPTNEPSRRLSRPHKIVDSLMCDYEMKDDTAVARKRNWKEGKAEVDVLIKLCGKLIGNDLKAVVIPDADRKAKKRSRKGLANAGAKKVEVDLRFDGIEALPEAPPLPNFPNTGYCDWSFDLECRIVLAKFDVGNDKPTMTSEDESFLLQMMERTDIAMVSEGLFDSMDPSLWDLDFISSRAGDKMFHRFRNFQTVLMGQDAFDAKRFGLKLERGAGQDDDSEPDFAHCIEKDGDISMTVGDHVRYLQQWEKVEEARSSGQEECYTFAYTKYKREGEGEEVHVDVRGDNIYLIDLDLKKLLPETFEDLKRNFLAPGILPGGVHCMMNSVSVCRVGLLIDQSIAD